MYFSTEFLKSEIILIFVLFSIAFSRFLLSIFVFNVSWSLLIIVLLVFLSAEVEFEVVIEGNILERGREYTEQRGVYSPSTDCESDRESNEGSGKVEENE